MQRRAGRSEFEHVAKHRDTPAVRPDLRLAEQVQRGGDRSGVGVVALIDDQGRAAGQIDFDRCAAAAYRFQFGQRQRSEREVGASQHGGCQHRKRIGDKVTARRADLVGEFGSENIRHHGRAMRMQRAFDETRVGLRVLAERHDARDARLLRAALELRKLRDVAVDDRGAARLEAQKDFGFSVGDFVERTEEFEMHRRDGRDHRHMRARQP